MTLRVLSNLPLECFDDRANFGPIDLCTYGPGWRGLVEGVRYPFDVDFDPSTGTLEQLLAALPRGWRPDLLLLWWPDQEPLPAGLERSPVPVVGVMSDYNLTLSYVAGLWPLFDVWLVDTPGVPLFEALSFADVRAFCQFSYKARHHRIWPGIARDVDVGFCGNLNPDVQAERAVWLERLLALRARGVRVEVRTGIHGDDYGRFLNRLRIGFNRSIRREMNLRAFEVPACGALLMLERENLEVARFLQPDQEVVLYDEHDFEQVVLELLADEPRRARIAAAGHRRIQEHSFGQRMQALARLLASPGRGRPDATPFDCALGRAVAMLATWADPRAAALALREAMQLAPADPRPRNALALALLRVDPARHGGAALELWRQATALAPDYVPAWHNLAAALAAGGDETSGQRARHELAARLERSPSWTDLDGPLLPVGFGKRAVELSHALQASVRKRTPEPLVAALAR